MREPLPLATVHETILEFLRSLGVSKEIMNSWRELVAEEIPEADDDDEFNSFTD